MQLCRGLEPIRLRYIGLVRVGERRVEMVEQWGRGVGGHSGLQVGGALIGQLFWKNL